MNDDEAAKRCSDWIEADKARLRQEFVSAIIVVVGFAIVVGILAVYR